MEKIRVNMTPCEEVKTIHASQDDNATRKWAFDLYDENGKIDSSDIKEQMIFDSRVGGTEQILPENTSDPTTSPIIADIQYPDSLRSEQTFLYRESPTSEDGQAKITRIKGNTVVWNQLKQDKVGTQTFSDNHITLTHNSDGSIRVQSDGQNSVNDSLTLYYNNSGFKPFPAGGHKVYIKCGSTAVSGLKQKFYVSPLQSWSGSSGIMPNNELNNNNIFDIPSTAKFYYWYLSISANTTCDVTIYPQIFDLTAMGLDTLSLAEVQQWFSNYYPLPYYDYTTGKLLPFKGESLKTTGKNQLPITLASLKQLNTSTTWNDNIGVYNGVTYKVNTNENGYVTSVELSGTASGASNMLLINRTISSYFNEKMMNKSLIINGCPSGGSANGYSIYGYRVRQGSNLNIRDTGNGDSFIFNPSVNSWNFAIAIGTGINVDGKVFYPMIRFADVTDNAYEPYTSSTINLPTLTYFSSGMKSAGSVYDEITDSKAVTRIGSVDLGSLGWNVYSLGNSCTYYAVVGSKQKGNNVLCSNYVITNSSAENMEDKTAKGRDNDNVIFVRDTSYTSASTFKQAMTDQNVKLYYELATPTETSFTTASLATENAEIPLSNDNGTLIGKCTEQLSENPGFFDAKIKLADADGECYSNKIQLHVERSPQ